MLSPNSGVDIEQDGDVPIKPRLVHFKCKTDPGWDSKGIAESLFLPDQKILVVLEIGKRRNYMHFQGYTLDAPRTITNKLSELAKRHCFRDPTSLYYGGPKCRPMSQVCDTVNIEGFQYTNKEPISAYNPIYSNGFTQEELQALQTASMERVEREKGSRVTKKSSIITTLHEKMVASDFGKEESQIINIALHHVDTLLQTKRHSLTKHTRPDMFIGLATHPDCTEHHKKAFEDKWTEEWMEDDNPFATKWIEGLGMLEPNSISV